MSPAHQTSGRRDCKHSSGNHHFAPRRGWARLVRTNGTSQTSPPFRPDAKNVGLLPALAYTRSAAAQLGGTRYGVDCGEWGSWGASQD